MEVPNNLSSMKKTGSRYVVLYCTTGSVDEASNIAEHLVGNHMVACVNVIPSIRSIYWWNNKVHQDNEALMVIKTEESRIPEIERSIRQLHSYETPELIALPIEYGMPEYLEWMAKSLSVRDDG